MGQSRDDVRRAYDMASEAYARVFTDELDHKPADRELLQRFARAVGAGQLVLDLGCGPGHTTDHLAALGLEAVGIDLSPAMIARAGELFPQARFEVGDFCQLDHADSTAAGILAFYCIVHLKPDELVPAFTEMHRVLAPDGTILLAFHVGQGTLRADNFLETDAVLDFSFFPTQEVVTAMQTAGLSRIEVHERPPYDTEHPSTRCYVWAKK